MLQDKETQEFIKNAQAVHGNKFSYKNTIYKKPRDKVRIICLKDDHGEFLQTPYHHVSRKQGCPKCMRNPKTDTKSFIKKANKVHDEFFTYEKVEYVNSHIDVIITCPKHGNFTQRPNNHLNGEGCVKCSKKYLIYDQESFIARAQVVHGNKFNYDSVVYEAFHKKIGITCPNHGIFFQTPECHLRGYNGCRKCETITTDIFVTKSRGIHGDKYRYSKTDYKFTKEKVVITCKVHGDFSQTPNNHLKGNGCPSCQETKKKETCLKKFGVGNPMQNPEIQDKQQKSSGKRKSFTLPSGKIVYLQGCEHHVLNSLLQEDDLFGEIFTEDEIITDAKEVPTFVYTIDGENHYYRPDFYIPKLNMIVEAKSTWTFKCYYDTKRNFCKWKTVLDANKYNMTVVICDTSHDKLKAMEGYTVNQEFLDKYEVLTKPPKITFI